MDKLRAKTLKQTCNACPAQWEGKIDDGRMFYIRYRWGHLSLNVSEKATDNVMDAVNNSMFFAEEIGDGFDGYLDEPEMKKLTSKVIDWQDIK